jgi:hypothetical protein
MASKNMPKRSLVQKIQGSVIKRFPEYAKVKPEISVARIEPQTNIFQKLSLGLPKRRVTIYKMRFRKDVTTEDKLMMRKILTITFNKQGDILKITESK